jgi:hypothetical protein
MESFLRAASSIPQMKIGRLPGEVPDPGTATLELPPASDVSGFHRVDTPSAPWFDITKTARKADHPSTS